MCFICILTSIIVDRQDKLRHDRIAYHASVLRGKSQPLQEPIISSLFDAKMSASRAHASPPSSSYRTHMAPTHASPHPSSRRRQVSHIQAPEAPEIFESLEVLRHQRYRGNICIPHIGGTLDTRGT